MLSRRWSMPRSGRQSDPPMVALPLSGLHLRYHAELRSVMISLRQFFCETRLQVIYGIRVLRPKINIDETIGLRMG